jgi:hypothetical protein
LTNIESAGEPGGPHPWRCFHCDEVFNDAGKARKHFGDDITSEPACKIAGFEGGLVAYIRDLERQLETYRAELDPITMAWSAREADHQRRVKDAEQKGYDAGLRDARAEALDLISAAHRFVEDELEQRNGLHFEEGSEGWKAYIAPAREVMDRLGAFINSTPAARAASGPRTVKSLRDALAKFACSCSGRCNEYEHLPAGTASCAFAHATATLRALDDANVEATGRKS